MSKRRLILIAHGLKSKEGHHYMEARSFKEEAQRQGAEAVILAHVDIREEIRDELQAHPVFAHTPYWQSLAKRRRKRWARSWSYVKSMKMSLRAMPVGPLQSSDVIVSTLTKARDIMALALWLRGMPKAQRPHLSLNFMVDDFTTHAGRGGELEIQKWRARYYRFAYKQVRRLVGLQKIQLTSGGREFAEAMTSVLGQQVQVAPLPVELAFDSNASESEDHHSQPVVAFIGHMAPIKGADLVGPAIRKVLQSKASCRFILQANPQKYAAKWREEIGEEGLRYTTIHIGELSQEQYQSILRESDILLLPYQANEYRLRTSGIFSEAMAMGKIAIISPNTWMAEMVGQQGGGAVIAQDETEEALTEAILKGLKEREALSSEMQRISRYWRDEKGMSSFVRQILDAASHTM